MNARLKEVMNALRDGISLDMKWYFVFMVRYMGYTKEKFVECGMSEYFSY